MSVDVATNQMSGKAPFGSNVARFPDRLHTSTGAKLGPGCYNVETGGFSANAVERRASGPGWARAYETSHMTALPYLLNKEAWDRSLEQPRKLGPGTYNIDNSLYTSTDKHFSRGILATRQPRFKEDKSMATPGPGTYGVGGVPHAVLEQKQKQSFGTVAMLDCGGNGQRSLPTMGSHLGPGVYTIPSSVDELVNKKTGSRGPYEVFTIDRSKPIMTGHYASVTNSLQPGKYDMKSSIDETLSKKWGQFGKAAQYPQQASERIIVSTLSLAPRSPSEPGPGQYDARDPYAKPLTQATKSPPFLSSCPRVDKMAAKFFTGNFNPVGPGRYDVRKHDGAQDSHGCQSVFKSKTDRPSGLRLRMLSERLASKNAPLPKDRPLVPRNELKCYKEVVAAA